MRGGWALLVSSAVVGGLGVERRAVLVKQAVAATALVGVPLGVPFTAAATEQVMKTSADFSSYTDVTGQGRAANLGAGSISGKSRPVTGVYLVEPPAAKGGVVSAEVVLTNSIIAKLEFESGLALAKGMYYDIECRDRSGNSAYVHVAASPPKKLEALPASYLTDAILRPSGRFGAFGGPTDIKVTSDERSPSGRLLELSFSATTPGGSTAPRRAMIAATTAVRSDDVVMLVASSSPKEWANGGRATAQKATASFKVKATRPTKLASKPASDFRFDERGGIREADLAE